MLWTCPLRELFFIGVFPELPGPLLRVDGEGHLAPAPVEGDEEGVHVP